MTAHEGLWEGLADQVAGVGGNGVPVDQGEEPGGGWAEHRRIQRPGQEGGSSRVIPMAPAALAGSVKIVPSDRIEILRANLADTTRVLGHWGVGTQELLGKKTES